MRVNIKVVYIPFEELIPSLEKGRINMSVSV
jgi:hypothetical protein